MSKSLRYEPDKNGSHLITYAKNGRKKYLQSTATVRCDETSWQKRVTDAADVVLEDFADVEAEFHFHTICYSLLLLTL